MKMDGNLIFDVGMHVGQDTDFYLKKGFRVVAIEANPELCEQVRSKFSSRIDTGQLTIVNRAISTENGPIDFYLNERDSVWGTANFDWVVRNEQRGAKSRKIRIEATTIGDIFHEFGIPYYLKIDIEGSDVLCLKGLADTDEKPKYVSVESSATSIHDTFEQLDWFQRLGYSKFKIVPQHTIGQQACPPVAREGRTIDYKFESGASGLFGSELPGSWRSPGRTRLAYLNIHFQCRMVGPNNGILRNLPSWKARRAMDVVFPKGRGWYDTHATF